MTSTPGRCSRTTRISSCAPGRGRLRAWIAYLWVERLEHAGRPLVRPLGVSPQAVYQAVARGQAMRAERERVLKW